MRCYLLALPYLFVYAPVPEIMLVQRPLLFEFNTQLSFVNYFPGCNAEIVSHLQNSIDLGREPFIYIWGESGLGKTHLLHASCQRAHELGKTSFIYSFKDDGLPPCDLLENLEAMDWVCIDNIDYIAGNAEWEQAFFNFFNWQREQDRHLLVSASCPPKYLTINLPDLKTRLNWGLTLKLQPLTDAECIAALQFKAAILGFEISPAVGHFLLTHFARDLPSLWRLLDQLDEASLAAKRKLTLPFLRSLLRESKAEW